MQAMLTGLVADASHMHLYRYRMRAHACEPRRMPCLKWMTCAVGPVQKSKDAHATGGFPQHAEAWHLAG